MTETAAQKDQKPEGRVTMRTEGHVAIVQVENEAKKNAFTPEMVVQLSDHFTAFDDDDNLWAMVFCAAGEHTTAGLDMPKFFGPKATAKPQDPNKVDPYGLGRRTMKPVISVVQGITYTIGIEMMLAADFVIAADSSRFQQLEARRGIAPLAGGHFRYITRAGYGNAMYHLLTCHEFDAQTALQHGLVQEVVPHGSQIDRAIELAQEICKNAPLGIRATKRAALAYMEELDKKAVEEIATIRSSVFGTEDQKEGIQSFVERREANWVGR